MALWPWLIGLGLLVAGRRRRGLPTGGASGGNWGTTPEQLRPLFARMEEVSGIAGSARFFAVVAAAESGWNPEAQNDDDGEVDASRRAYDNNAASRPALKYANEAREFGSGGLFGRLAPYFLWSASAELGDAAPLLDRRPDEMFEPRLSAYAAVVLLRRLLLHYDVRDLLDARVGWAAVVYLSEKRNTDTYFEIRSDFAARAQKVGIDLSLLPERLEPGPWVGWSAAYSALVES